MQSTTQILQDTEQWLNRPERQDSLVRYFRIFLLILAIINGLGVIAALWLWYQGTEKPADNSSAYYSLPAGLFQAAYIIVAELDFKEIRARISTYCRLEGGRQRFRLERVHHPLPVI